MKITQLKMCLLLSTKLHPDYPLIILSNRDEFYSRPTQRASFIDGNILSPLDMAREEHGTWLGVTKTGKIAVLVNYRENLQKNPISKISRGLIPQLFLKSELSPEKWHSQIKQQTNNFKDVGGFSLLFGYLQFDKRNETIRPLHIMSNRTNERVHVFSEPTSETGSLLSDEESKEEFESNPLSSSTIGLSNSLYLNPWPKVVDGEQRLTQMINTSISEHWSEDKLIQGCLDVLSVSNPPDHKDWSKMTYLEAFQTMPQSIFIPPVHTQDSTNTRVQKNHGMPLSGKYYGTRSQTIILVDKFGKVKYVERDLHNSDDLSEVPSVQTYEFKVASWNHSTESECCGGKVTDNHNGSENNNEEENENDVGVGGVGEMLGFDDERTELAVVL
ncbi:unnamed protein product [Ambrosiozyma monospora]|uniref:Unnamed protein product n=1 Tax=Ambrosiozyma monospora TaxID=43982 RepID=A0ACB5TB44_AMBMO|nr:unnamed protein product [Ambrosiozyma monospora]